MSTTTTTYHVPHHQHPRTPTPSLSPPTSTLRRRHSPTPRISRIPIPSNPSSPTFLRPTPETPTTCLAASGCSLARTPPATCTDIEQTNQAPRCPLRDGCQQRSEELMQKNGLVAALRATVVRYEDDGVAGRREMGRIVADFEARLLRGEEELAVVSGELEAERGMMRELLDERVELEQHFDMLIARCETLDQLAADLDVVVEKVLSDLARRDGEVNEARAEVGSLQDQVQDLRVASDEREIALDALREEVDALREQLGGKVVELGVLEVMHQEVLKAAEVRAMGLRRQLERLGEGVWVGVCERVNMENAGGLDGEE